MNWFDDPLARFLQPSTIVDVYFLPVYVSIVSWMFYMWFFYRRILSNVESRKTLSKGILWLCLFGGSWAAFMPHAWLALIGFAGMVHGVQFYFLGKDMTKGEASRQFFRNHAVKNFVSYMFHFAIGVFIAYYLNVDIRVGMIAAEVSRSTIYIIIITGSLITTFFAWMAWQSFVRPSRVAGILGLYYRGRPQ